MQIFHAQPQRWSIYFSSKIPIRSPIGVKDILFLTPLVSLWEFYLGTLDIAHFNLNSKGPLSYVANKICHSQSFHLK